MWAKSDDVGGYELCCTPFFTDGYGALDIADEVQERAVLSVLGRWHGEGACLGSGRIRANRDRAQVPF